jgi:hypothetical protein
MLEIVDQASIAIRIAKNRTEKSPYEIDKGILN